MSEPQKKPSVLKKTISLALKLLFVGVVFYFLGKKGFISLSEIQRAITQLDRIIPATLALFTAVLLSTLRWQWLLQAQNIHLKLSRVCQLVFIGQFFNVALPGAVSGDFVKAFYIANEIQGQRARAFGSILFDRIVGLSALVLVSAGALGLNLVMAEHIQEFLGTALFKGIQVFLSIAAVSVVIFFSYLFLLKEHHDPVSKLLKHLETKFSKLGSITRIYIGIRHYHHHRWTVTKALLLSVLIHLSVGYSCIQFAYALGETQLSVLSLYTVVPLGLLVTAVPIAPAGVGTGHVAFGGLFHLLGSQRGADVFSFYVLVQLLQGAVGGLVYLRFKGAKLPSSEMAMDTNALTRPSS